MEPVPTPGVDWRPVILFVVVLLVVLVATLLVTRDRSGREQ